MDNKILNKTIDEIGFLSDQIEQWIDNNKKENKELFSLIYSYNIFAQSIMFDIQAHDNNAQELLIATLYVRSLSRFQSSIILIERCLESESKIIIRSLMEIMFILVACSKDKQLAERYILSENIDRLKSIRRLKNNKSSIDGLINIDDMLEVESELENNISQNEVSKISIEDFSRKSGLHKNYLIVYDVLSKSVHSTSRELSELLDLEKKIFKWGPKYSNIEYLLVTCISYHIIITDSVIDFFKIENKSPVIKSFNDSVMNLIKKNRAPNKAM